MEMLPPTGWADVATKRDLDQLRLWINAKFEATASRRDLRRTMHTMMAFDVALVAAVIAAVGLT